MVDHTPPGSATSVGSRRYLVVNADDFGRSPGINRGIITAHEHGIVTSASLLVRGDAVEAAAAYARASARLSLGLHVDLGEWTYRDGEWTPRYEVVPLADPQAVGDEIARQIASFREVVGRDPTHLDSHQHVHRREPVRSAMIAVATRLGVPLRGVSPRVRYCGAFYGQSARGDPVPDGIAVEALTAILASLSPGITELGCHPGDAAAEEPYGAERRQEVEVLCDPRVREALAAHGITLISFHDVSRAGKGASP